MSAADHPANRLSFARRRLELAQQNLVAMHAYAAELAKGSPDRLEADQQRAQIVAYIDTTRTEIERLEGLCEPNGPPRLRGV